MGIKPKSVSCAWSSARGRLVRTAGLEHGRHKPRSRTQVDSADASSVRVTTSRPLEGHRPNGRFAARPGASERLVTSTLLSAGLLLYACSYPPESQHAAVKSVQITPRRETPETQLPVQSDWIDRGVVVARGAVGDWDHLLYGGFAGSIVRRGECSCSITKGHGTSATSFKP
jgi:hypothetical protein